MKVDKRAFLFYGIGLVMCHSLELIYNTYRFTHFYIVGLIIYLITFTVIWLIISRREYTFLQLWTIGFIVGFIIEIIIVREIGEIIPLLIVSVLFWGLLYTAINYELVKRISKKIGLEGKGTQSNIS